MGEGGRDSPLTEGETSPVLSCKMQWQRSTRDWWGDVREITGPWVLSMEPWREFVSNHRAGTLADARTVRAMELGEAVMLLSQPYAWG